MRNRITNYGYNVLSMLFGAGRWMRLIPSLSVRLLKSTQHPHILTRRQERLVAKYYKRLVEPTGIEPATS